MEFADLTTLIRTRSGRDVDKKYLSVEEEIMSEGDDYAVIAAIRDVVTSTFRYIKTEDNHAIRVEVEQPFVAENKGLTQAQDLTLEDRILTGDGKYTKITVLEDEEYDYNQRFSAIETEGHKNYIANGLVIGDQITLMNLVGAKSGNSLSAKEQAMIDKVMRMAEAYGIK